MTSKRVWIILAEVALVLAILALIFLTWLPALVSPRT